MKSKSSLARKWDKNSLIPRENKGDVQLFPAAGNSSYHVAFENSIESISRLINDSSNKQLNLYKIVLIVLTRENFWT